MFSPPADYSLWRESYQESLYPRLNRNLKVDVAVIGAGITGLTAAYLLKQTGRTVAVVEKASVGSGTSGRTTGKVTYQHGLIYSTLQRRLGTGTARVYAEANRAAFDKVASIIRRRKISCGWQRDDNYVFTTDREQVGRFKREAKVALGLGLPADFTTAAPLPFPIRGAVRFRDQAKFNAQEYLLGLASWIDGEGSHVFENSLVHDIKDGSPATIRTASGKITARDIIVATNVPTLPLLARGTYCLVEYPQESYIVAGRLRKPLDGMYISPDKRNYSILPVTVGDKDYVLIGGEGHLSGLRISTRLRYRRLAAYARERFGVKHITHRWSDRDYMAYDDMPVIGKVYPHSKHLYTASAFRKWGLTNGTAAAMILCDTICGEDNPWAATFNPHRPKIAASIPHAIASYLGRE